MNKDRFLTVRWNYTIALAQGLPTFGYVAYALSTKLWTTMTGMLVLAILGALF